MLKEYIFILLIFYSNVYLDSCKFGYYQENKECFKCTDHCNVCSSEGQYEYECEECAEPYYLLVESANDIKGACITACAGTTLWIHQNLYKCVDPEFFAQLVTESTTETSQGSRTLRGCLYVLSFYLSL